MRSMLGPNLPNSPHLQGCRPDRSPASGTAMAFHSRFRLAKRRFAGSGERLGGVLTTEPGITD